MEMPKPEAATRNISTISRFLLKYWATISVEVSRVRPTPRPKGQTNIIKVFERKEVREVLDGALLL